MLLGDAPRLGVYGDQGEAHLQDPAVHDVAHTGGQLDLCLVVYSLGQSEMVQLSADCSPLAPLIQGSPGSPPPLPVVSPARRQWGSNGLGSRGWGPAWFCVSSVSQCWVSENFLASDLFHID